MKAGASPVPVGEGLAPPAYPPSVGDDAHIVPFLLDDAHIAPRISRPLHTPQAYIMRKKCKIIKK